MAFHTACPFTCRKICFCPEGFPKGKNEFLDVTKFEEFLKDPWGLKAKQPATCQVKVPKLRVASPPQVPVGDGGGSSGGDGEEAASIASAQTKRAALQKKAAAASNVAEDFARGFQSGDVEGSMKDVGGEEQRLSNVKVMCRLCFSCENEGGERARKMMSCNCCGKKCHLSCLKTWGQHRDLFHWSSWTCPSCRLCEGCQTTGDPNKFMYCKRCDAAYHCHCMQPPHKNVSSGPYLCPKHTKCHSCCSSVPGNGLSVRWFLGYTCCDACGRLFMKRKYCQVCLKVYRDSETTPMVCCDICERWVHSQCDGISDEKYLQFQVDGNLPYSCPKCRGYSYQSINPENAVQELWRRKDLADRDLIASLRAGAGLPVEDEMFSISPFSDDEDTAPVVKNEHKKSLKFSRKGLVDKSPQKSKEYGKKFGKEKGLTGQNEGHPDAPSGGYSAGDVKNDELQVYGELDSFSSPSGSLTEGICSFNMAGVIKHKFIDEVAGNTGKRTVQRKGSKPQRLDGDDVGIQTSMPKTSKEPKGVIHLGSLDKNIAGPPKSDASSCQKEQDLTTSHGYKDLVQLRENENSERNETAATLGGGKESNLIEITKASSEATHFPAKVGGKFADGSRPYPQLKTSGYEDLVRLRENENSERNETAAILGGGKVSNLIKIKNVCSEASHFTAKVGGKFTDGSGPYPPLKTSGYEDLVQLRENENSERNETAAILGGGKESNLIKIKKVSSEATQFPAKVGGKFADGSGPYPPLKTSGYEDLVQLREKENSERNETAATLGGGKESTLIKIKKVSAEATHFPAKVGGKFPDGSGPLKTSGYEGLVQLREKENSERNETAATLGGGKESTLIKIKKVSAEATHFPAKVGGKFPDGSGPLKTSGYEGLVQLREKENSERNETAATLGGGKESTLIKIKKVSAEATHFPAKVGGKFPDGSGPLKTSGYEDLVQLREKENSERNETAATLGGGKESTLIKIKKVSAEATHFPAKVGGKFPDGSGPLKTSGNEDLVQLRENENSERNETAATLGGGKESNLIKIKKVSSEATHFPAKVGGKFADGSGPYPPLKTSGILGKRSNDSSVITKAGSEVPATRDNKLASVKHVKAWLTSCDDLNEEKNGSPSLSNLPRMDPRPLQRPKFKNPYHESQNALASPGEEEKSMDKGHESKRMRSPAFEEKASTRSDDNSSQRYEDIDDFLADKWILQKLGQNAKGKRVEFHHLFDNTWHRGTVVEVSEGSSVVSVALDDGNTTSLELGKQGIRLISSKQNC